jgi:hypothetical protein
VVPAAATREQRSLSPTKFWWPSITCSPSKFPTTTWEIVTWTSLTKATSHATWCIAWNVWATRVTLTPQQEAP